MADQGSEGLLSPYLRRRRISAAASLLRGSVLDIGCGIGAITTLCKPSGYAGLDIDSESLSIARRLHPNYRFISDLPVGEHFDTVCALAVIEHLPDPSSHICAWTDCMAPHGRMILTSPHPSLEWVHAVGARIGLFSHHASEEHVQLIDLRRMKELAGKCGLQLSLYRRFLCGANQLFVLHR